MKNIIEYKGVFVNYEDEGSGKIIVLLHGYMESIETWGEFATELSKFFRVIRIDLPGHGKTGSFSDTHEMEFMAEVVHYLLLSICDEKYFMIGHSMGGYVTLAYVEKYWSNLSGISLFHSTPFADSKEKRIARERTIEMVKAGKKELLFKEHVPKTFSKENLKYLKNEITRGTYIARLTTEQGIIAALNGMKNRKDMQNVLQNTMVPVLYIQGMKDNFIAFDTVDKILFPKNYQTLILENSGHMGFVEEREKSIKAIMNFINNRVY